MVKNTEQLFSYASEIVEYFIKENKLIVLACNTTSATVLNELQAVYKSLDH
ncbi:MAG: hypothetical protein ACLRQF_24500 [Thomasclavelia ramosa]